VGGGQLSKCPNMLLVDILKGQLTHQIIELDPT